MIVFRYKIKSLTEVQKIEGRKDFDCKSVGGKIERAKSMERRGERGV
jgi:hypothetical protein